MAVIGGTDAAYGTKIPGNPYGTNYGASAVYGPGSYGYGMGGVPANAYGQPGLNPYSAGGSAYTVGGNPYGGNLYAGLPTNIQQTPFGSAYAQASKYVYSPQQMRTTAAQQAGAQTQAGLQSSYANQAAEQAVLGAQQTRAAGLAAALGSFGPEYASAMQNAYNQAANTVGQFGTGVVQGGGQALTDAQNAAQAAAAAKTGGQGQVSSYNVPDITGALTQTGVNIPGNSLAVSGLNAAQMGIYGAQADKGYALNTVDYYRQQAMNALQQRAAERAGIIAQRPELYQNALEAQRQDNYQTLSRIDSLVSNASNYIVSLRSNAIQRASAGNQWLLGMSSLTHVNPFTGQPMANFTWADKAHTTVVGWKDLAAYKAAMAKVAATNRRTTGEISYWTGRNNIAQQRANQATGQKIGTFDKALSTAWGMAVDGSGRPILDPRTGMTSPYKPPAKPGTKAKTLTPGQLQRATGTVNQIVHNLRYGNIIPATKTKAGLNYAAVQLPDAITYLQRGGYFATPQISQVATQALSQFWPPYEVQAALGKVAGPPVPSGQDTAGSYPGADPYAPTTIAPGTTTPTTTTP